MSSSVRDVPYLRGGEMIFTASCSRVCKSGCSDWTANKLYCWYLRKITSQWRSEELSCYHYQFNGYIDVVLFQHWKNCRLQESVVGSTAWWVIVTFIILFSFLVKYLLMLSDPRRQKPWDEIFQCKVLYGRITVTQSWFSNADVVLNFRSKICCAEWMRWRDFCED